MLFKALSIESSYAADRSSLFADRMMNRRHLEDPEQQLASGTAVKQFSNIASQSHTQMKNIWFSIFDIFFFIHFIHVHLIVFSLESIDTMNGIAFDAIRRWNLSAEKKSLRYSFKKHVRPDNHHAGNEPQKKIRSRVFSISEIVSLCRSSLWFVGYLVYESRMVICPSINYGKRIGARLIGPGHIMFLHSSHSPCIGLRWLMFCRHIAQLKTCRLDYTWVLIAIVCC